MPAAQLTAGDFENYLMINKRSEVPEGALWVDWCDYASANPELFNTLVFLDGQGPLLEAKAAKSSALADREEADTCAREAEQPGRSHWPPYSGWVEVFLYRLPPRGGAPECLRDGDGNGRFVRLEGRVEILAMTPFGEVRIESPNEKGLNGFTD